MTFQILPFDPITADKELLNLFLDHQERVHDAYYPMDYLLSRVLRRKEAKQPPSKNRKQFWWIAKTDDQIIGTAYFSFSTPQKETNPDLFFAKIHVEPEYTQNGIAKTLLKEIVKAAKEHGKTKFISSVSNQTPYANGQQWLEKLGNKILEERVNRLYKAEINHTYINEKLPVLEKKLGKYQFVGFTKDEYLDRLEADDQFAEALADFYTEVGNLVPRGDLSIEDTIITANDLRNNIESEKNSVYDEYVLYALDGEKIIAVSETYHWKWHNIPFICTGLTGVRKAYQGQEIATYLKIKIIKYFVDLYPEIQFFKTENTDQNEKMLAINTKLGFREAYRWIEYEGTIDSLEKYL